MSALQNKSAESHRGRSSIRTRVLAIAFIPSLVFLLSGVALAGYLVFDASQDRDFTTKVRNAAAPAGALFADIREERRLTLQDMSITRSLRTEVERQRRRTDTSAAKMTGLLDEIAQDAPDSVRSGIGLALRRISALDSFRDEIDRGETSLHEVYDFYNGIIDAYTTGLDGVAQRTPNAETAYQRTAATPLLTSADGMSRGDALAAAGIGSGGLTEQEFRSFIGQIGAYHATLEQAVPTMIPSVRQKYDALVGSNEWEALTTVENAFLRGNTTELPVRETEWRAAAAVVSAGLWDLYVEQSTVATDLAQEQATSTLVVSVVAGAGVIIVALVTSLVAWRMSNRLVRRLVSLREATLDVADERMPRIVERLRAGEQVDLASEVSYLDHGDDEIGQVAEAFNKAQRTAIAAAVDEAETREGTRRVFLNIAHRSQVIVHRQLSTLDEAERKQEDPDQLDLLFRLDHLSTRARRNAENLIILGGEQPGRQFRRPVPVTDIVRGAIAETEDYKRVNVGKVPETAVAGPVVGDLVHLLAELIDNATSFSPPQSRVEVRGELVGRGVVIEIEDQGIGVEPEELDRLNGMLREPPDFSFMALSEEPRLGLFVVARLADKHDFTVTLRESAYGGTRAIVLVRAELLGDPASGDDTVGDGAGPHTREQPLQVPGRRPRALPGRGPERPDDGRTVVEAPAVNGHDGTGAGGVTPVGAGPGSAGSNSVGPSSAGPGNVGPGGAAVDGTGPDASGADHTESTGHGISGALAPGSDAPRPELPRRGSRRRSPSATTSGRLGGHPVPGNENRGEPAGERHVSGELPAVIEAEPADDSGSRRAAAPEHAPDRRTELTDLTRITGFADLADLGDIADDSEARTQYVPRLPVADTRRPHGNGARHRAREEAPAHPERSAPGAPAQSRPDTAPGGLDASRPPLPRRRRQENLAPQLADGTAVAASRGRAVPATDDGDSAPTPEQARSRLSAFQQGTRRARQHPTSRDDSRD